MACPFGHAYTVPPTLPCDTVDYRLAPEHPYPAALHDVTAAYQALLQREGGGAPIVVSGESAGGNLALALLVNSRQHGLAMPAAAVLFSPMTDLSVTGDSYATKAHTDPNIAAAAIQTRANDYLNGTGTNPADALVSPIFTDLTGLPRYSYRPVHTRCCSTTPPAWPPEPRPTTSASSSTNHRRRARLSSLLRGPRRRRPGPHPRWRLRSGARPSTGNGLTQLPGTWQLTPRVRRCG